MTVPQVTFSWYDYLLFSVMLGLSALIGIYFGCFGNKQATANEYLMGGKKMKVVPIAVSLVASHISGLTLLGVPADVYRYGAGLWNFVLVLSVVAPCTIFIYLPVFFKLQVTSTYEYLERRFDSTTRTLASFLFAFGVLIYLPIVVYIPALALSAATGINTHYITPVVCGVCIFYTTLGGLKAVVWTDTLQFTVTVGAVFTVAVIGVRTGGGFGEIWSKVEAGQRATIFDFTPDLTVRDTFWAINLGLITYWIAMAAVHQSCVQKFLAVPTLRDAKLAVILFCIGVTIITSLSIYMGLIMYARYSGCDPFTSGVVQKNDQLLPYYIMDVASDVKGLPGLFIAGIFCAGLSTLSANLNCLAGTVYEDFIVKVRGPVEDEKKIAFILKSIVVISGIICTALVFVVEKMGSILAVGLALAGVTAGPLFGMFTLGVLFPKASSKGVFYGAILGLICAGTVAAMHQYYKAQGVIADIPKPTSVQKCPNVLSDTQFENFTTLPMLNTTDESPHQEYQPFILFRMSHYYTAPFGALVTMTVGLLISYLARNDDPPVHRDLLSPVIHFLLPKETVTDGTPKDYYPLDKGNHLVTAHTDDGKT